jgi:hypothetical protein
MAKEGTVAYFKEQSEKYAAEALAAREAYEKKYGKQLAAGNATAVKGFKKMIANLRKSGKEQLKIARHNVGEKNRHAISERDGRAMDKALTSMLSRIAQKSAYSSDYSSAVSGEPVAKRKTKKSKILDKGAGKPTDYTVARDTAEGAGKQKKARELKDKQASGGKQDTGENKNKKLDFELEKKSTVGMKNTVSSDQGKSKPKPTKTKWKVEYGKIIDDVQEEANLNKGGSVKYKSKMKKGGLVTKRGPMHRSSKRKS